MKLVLQRGSVDCGVATLAMVLDLPYEAADHLIVEQGGLREYGLTTQELERACLSVGRPCSQLLRVKGLSWPPLPFALAHFAAILPGGRAGGHLVAVDRYGVIFDPRGPELAVSDLPRIQDLNPNLVISIHGLIQTN